MDLRDLLGDVPVLVELAFDDRKMSTIADPGPSFVKR
jgi:hypothetical protein